MPGPQFDSVWGFLLRSYGLLIPSERKGLLWMGLLILINSFIEILGLAAVLPVIAVVVEPDLIDENKWMSGVRDVFVEFNVVDSNVDFILLLNLLMISAFLFKALFGLAVSWIQSRYGYRASFRLTGLMWDYHFNHSLVEMKEKDSGKVLAEINQWPGGFTNTFVVGGLKLLNEIVVVVLIAVGLLVYSPLVLGTVGLLIAIGVLIIRLVTKNRVHAYGAQLMILGPKSNTLIGNAVRGYLEVVTFQAASAVRDNYLGNLWSIIRVSTRQAVINTFPSKMYEVLSVGAVAVAIVVGILLDESSSSFFSLLSLMALSAYRVMPSMNRISASVIGMRVGWYHLEAMEKAVEAQEAKDLSAIDEKLWEMGVNDVIECRGLTLGYDTLPEPVLSDFNWTLQMGRMHCIVGPSGCGKSTLMNALLGLHLPSEGEIVITRRTKNEAVVLSKDIAAKSWLGNAAYLSQQPFLFRGTVRDNLTMGVPGRELNEDLCLSLVLELGLQECLGNDPLEFRLNEGASNLSGGQQQRLALLRALQLQKPILVLDEATSALDAGTRDVVFGKLRELTEAGGMVILITHDPELAARCDEVVDLSRHQ